MEMSNTPEPVLDLSEIVDLYKEDARRMIAQMRSAVGRWDEVAAGGTARNELRRLSHQLRGSGRTYGFRSVTRICKAMENIVLQMEKKGRAADDRVKQSITDKVQKLAVIFKG